MYSIDNSEKERLKKWAEEEKNSESFNRSECGADDSFWVDKTHDNTYISRYGFESVPEFEMLCTNILGHEFDSRIKMAVYVATIKNMPKEKKRKDKAEEEKEGKKLPDYIYVF